MAWKGNYIALFYVDVFTYACTNPNVGLPDRC